MLVGVLVSQDSGIVELLPKGWGSVRSFHLKLLDSLALPLYQSIAGKANLEKSDLEPALKALRDVEWSLDSLKGGKWSNGAKMTEEALAEQQRMFAEARAKMNGKALVWCYRASCNSEL
ncbi:hypothetical protein K1719_032807 [Acacia pycnantha]|nr:hypothetical protein K1719_032807 [Acacia pycnantha]